MTKYTPMNLKNYKEILILIASSNSEYESFINENKLKKFSDNDIRLPLEFSEETLSVLSEDPQQASAIKLLSENYKTTDSFVTGGEISALLAVVFVLRTHIKLERTTTGKWKLLIEHKPGDSKLLSELLKRLEKWWDITA